MKYLLGLLVIFEVSDGLLTYFLVGRGLAREGNPFLMPYVGESNFLIIKVVGALICALLLWDIHKRFPRVAVTVASMAMGFYALVVLWNLSIVLAAHHPHLAFLP